MGKSGLTRSPSEGDPVLSCGEDNEEEEGEGAVEEDVEEEKAHGGFLPLPALGLTLSDLRRGSLWETRGNTSSERE